MLEKYSSPEQHLGENNSMIGYTKQPHLSSFTIWYPVSSLHMIVSQSPYSIVVQYSRISRKGKDVLTKDQFYTPKNKDLKYILFSFQNRYFFFHYIFLNSLSQYLLLGKTTSVQIEKKIIIKSIPIVKKTHVQTVIFFTVLLNRQGGKVMKCSF